MPTGPYTGRKVVSLDITSAATTTTIVAITVAITERKVGLGLGGA